MLIKFETLLEKYNFLPKGIIHIGAHAAEESVVYARSGVKKVIWIEGNPELIPNIQDNVSMFPENNVYCALLSDTDNKKIEFNLTNFSMSSSILDLGTHSVHYPNIKVTNKIELFTQRFDMFSKKNNLELSNYNFLNLDIQGAELLAIKGMGDTLNCIDYIYTEVNVAEVYKDCALLDKMDLYLTSNGFNRVELKLYEAGWGDAFYVRQYITDKKKQDLIKEAKDIIIKYNQKPSISTYLRKNFSKKIRKIILKIPLISIALPFVNKMKTLTKSKELSHEKPAIQSEELNNLEKVLSRKSKSSVVLFDVGGNLGEFTKNCIIICEKYDINYQIYIFEPQASCVKKLNEIFGKNNKINIVPFALSDKKENINIYKDKEASSQASLYKREIFSSISEEKIATISLDQFCLENNINNIFLLKIDTEGHELHVLKGAKNSLATIENIQFEYGGTFKDAGCTLKECFQILKYQFYIGKINEANVNFTPFSPEMEDYKYANYFAEKIK